MENLIDHPPNNNAPEPTHSEISGPPHNIMDRKTESCANVNEHHDHNESAASRTSINTAPILLESDI